MKNLTENTYDIIWYLLFVMGLFERVRKAYKLKKIKKKHLIKVTLKLREKINIREYSND